MKKINVLIVGGLFLNFSYSLTHAETSKCLQQKTESCLSEDLNIERKFSVSKLLNGLAHTCHNLGKAVVAETPKEKQAAALGIVSSLLMLAGNITEKEKAAQPTAVMFEQPVQDDEDIETKMVDVICRLVHELDTPDYRFADPSQFPHLRSIQALKTDDERCKLILQKFHCCKNKLQALFKEVFAVLQQRIGERTFALRQINNMRHIDDDIQRGQILLQISNLFQALVDFIGDVVHTNEIATYVSEQMILLQDYFHQTTSANSSQQQPVDTPDQHIDQE